MTSYIIIAAHDPNLVIGNNGRLPWSIPEDLKHFKRVTMGHPLLMGRGVFEEIGEKPLPGRENFVLTSRNYPNVATFKSIEEATSYFGNFEIETVFIIGGGEIYKQMLHLADKLIITLIHKSYDGDVFFPEYRPDIGKTWKEISREDYDGYSFVEYERVGSS